MNSLACAAMASPETRSELARFAKTFDKTANITTTNTLVRAAFIVRDRPVTDRQLQRRQQSQRPRSGGYATGELKLIDGIDA